MRFNRLARLMLLWHTGTMCRRWGSYKRGGILVLWAMQTSQRRIARFHCRCRTYVHRNPGRPMVCLNERLASGVSITSAWRSLYSLFQLAMKNVRSLLFKIRLCSRLRHKTKERCFSRVKTKSNIGTKYRRPIQFITIPLQAERNYLCPVVLLFFWPVCHSLHYSWTCGIFVFVRWTFKM